MHNENGLAKRLLSLVLSLVMAFTLVSEALAIEINGKAPGGTVNLVSFGDSMTNGYGHDGYYEEWDDAEGNHHSVQVNGFRQNDVTTTYPALLMQALKNSGYKANWEALAVSCMRTEDVNFLLRYHTEDEDWNALAAELGNIDSSVENWNNTQKERWEATFVDDGNVIGDYFTWNEFVNGRFRDWRKTTNYKDKDGYEWNSNPTLAYAKYYQNAVKNADVITLGTGNANFGVIMLQNITSYLTGTFGSGFKDAVPVREVIERRFPAEIKDTALEILDKVDELVVPELGMLGEKADKVLEIVEHTTVSFMFSYMDMLHAIDELNDKENLDVIMMGLMNTMDGVKIDTGNGTLDLGAVVDGITDVLSAYYFILPVALQVKGDFENITFYVVPNDDHIEMQISDMASLEKIKQSNTIRDRMIQAVSGMIFNLVRQPLNNALTGTGFELPTWSMDDNTAYQYREKVEAYEQLQANYKTWVDSGRTGEFTSTATSLLNNPNDVLACAVYLAFEQAIIANADNATLDLNGLMSLMSGTDALAGMMTPIAGALTGENGEFSESKQQEMKNKVAESALAHLTALLTEESGSGVHTNGVTGASGSTPEEKAANYAATAIAPMFTAIELTGALNGALGGALVSEDAASLGGLLSLYARMIIGNGIGSHPNAAGHETLFNEILEVYPDTPAIDWAMDMAKETAQKLYRYAVENGDKALGFVVNYALEQGWINAEQAAMITTHVLAANSALYRGDKAAALASCEKMAEMLYDYACDNGYISAEVQETIDEVCKVYAKISSMTTDELKAFVAKQIEDLTAAYGPVALKAFNEYVISLNVLDAQQLAVLEEKINAFIEMSPDAREAAVQAVANELVDYVFTLTKLDRDMVAEIYTYLTTTSQKQMVADAAKLLMDYVAKYGPTALDYVENYLIAEGYITNEAIQVITQQIRLAIAAYNAQDEVAAQASFEKLMKLLYAYADENGFIPAELKAAVAMAMELYEKLENVDPEQVKSIVFAELKKFIAAYKAEALIALQTYITNEGWMSDISLKELTKKIADTIAAYKVNPEEVADAMARELVEYLYNKAVAEGYIDPTKVEDLNKFVTMVKEAIDYFVNFDAEQAKADAIALLFDEISKVTNGLINDAVFERLKMDVAELIDVLERAKPENIQKDVENFIDSVKSVYIELINNATHGEYFLYDTSYYLALGGDTVYGTGIGRWGDKSYYDLLLEEWEMDTKTQFKSLAKKNFDLSEVLSYIEQSKDEIKKADFITYQVDATALISTILSDKDPQWNKYFTEEELAFVEEALPVIRDILVADWTKYVNIDADILTDAMVDEVLDSISKSASDMFKQGSDEFQQLLPICISQMKAYVAFMQSQAEEAAKLIPVGDAWINNAFEIVNRELNKNWADYADLDVDEITAKIMAKVKVELNQAETYSAIGEAKLEQLIRSCAEQIVAMHHSIREQIAKLPSYLPQEVLGYAEKIYPEVQNFILDNWSDVATIDAKEIHEQVYAWMIANKPEFNFDVDKFLALGEDEVTEVLNTCEELAVEAISTAKEEAISAANVLGTAYSELEEMILPLVAKALAANWAEYVGKTATEIVADIQDVVMDELEDLPKTARTYCKQYANELNVILTVCVDEVKDALAFVQNEKTELLDTMEQLKDFEPYAEKLLYTAIVFAVDTAKAVNAIQAINPDATLVVVGMYNPLDGLELIVGGQTIDVGQYMGYLIDATNVYYTALAVAMADDNFTFVAVPDTEINGFDQPINLDQPNLNQIISKLLGLQDKMYANANGHKYIKDQILDALTVTAFALDSIAITTPASKLSYVAGQSFDKTGMVVTATYNDNTTATVTNYTLSSNTNLTASQTSVTISYTEGGVTKTTTQAITVVPKAVTGIEITATPTKLSYVEGQSFDPAGMVVTATYNDDDTATVTNYTLSSNTNLTASQTSVTISYTEGGVTKTTTQPITVAAKTVTSIEITATPTKLSYVAGQSFDKTGMVVKATYNDNTTATVTDYTLSSNTNLTVGQTSVTISYRGKSVTQSITVVAKALDSIAITTSASKTNYVAGQNFDKTGMVVTATYNDGTTATVTDYTLSSDTNLTVGQTAVTISYGGKSVDQSITVVAKALVSIAVTTPASKTDYVAGQNFDPAGMVVTATYNDGTTATITNYNLSNNNNLPVNRTAVNIYYTEGSVTKTTTQQITVVAKAVTGIEITATPTKLSYVAGQNFDKTGMVVKATYNDGTTVAVTNYTVTNGSNLTTGQTSVTISYTESGVTKTATQPITVATKVVTGIAVTTAPRKTSYVAGQNFDTAGMVVKATYNDGTSETITVGFDVTNGSNLTAGQTSVTISYGGKTTTQKITVAKKAVTSITVKTPPTKTEYLSGEKFDPTGLVLNVNYNDGDIKQVSDGFTCNRTGALNILNRNVTVSYGGKSVKIPITVKRNSQGGGSSLDLGALAAVGVVAAVVAIVARYSSIIEKLPSLLPNLTKNGDAKPVMNTTKTVLPVIGTKPIVAAAMPLVAMGDSNEAVKTLQTKLNALGYNCGEADGVFGAATYDAVVKFQTAKGLIADGIVGQATWEKLS